IQDETDEFDEGMLAPPADLLAPSDSEGLTSEEEIEQLMRESTQREAAPTGSIGTNWRPNAPQAGSTTLGTPAPSTPATPSERPAPHQRQREEQPAAENPPAATPRQNQQPADDRQNRPRDRQQRNETLDVPPPE